jgi:hypothetical protein
MDIIKVGDLINNNNYNNVYFPQADNRQDNE